MNCSITFDNKSFVIQERGSERQIGEGYEAGGLYHFGSRPRVSCVAAPNPKMLHDRLGHPHLSKLKKMFPELSSLQTLECESCQLGKHVKSTFLKGLNQSVLLVFLSSISIFGDLVVSHLLALGILLLSLMNIRDVLGFIL